MLHSIPDNIPNSAVEHCIAEYVRLTRDRDILRDHWFNGLSFNALSEKYDLSVPALKAIVYKIGDGIIERVTQ